MRIKEDLLNNCFARLHIFYELNISINEENDYYVEFSVNDNCVEYRFRYLHNNTVDNLLYINSKKNSVIKKFEIYIDGRSESEKKIKRECMLSNIIFECMKINIEDEIFNEKLNNQRNQLHINAIL